MPRTLDIALSVDTLSLQHLGESLADAQAGGISEIVVPVGDGVFAPMFGYGEALIEAVREGGLEPHVYLMAAAPERHFDRLMGAGASCITFHIERCIHPDGALNYLREAGLAAGIALRPGTSLTELDYLLYAANRVMLPIGEPGIPAEAPSRALFERTQLITENIRYRELRVDVDVLGACSAYDAAKAHDRGAARLILTKLPGTLQPPLEAGLPKFRAEVLAKGAAR